MTATTNLPGSGEAQHRPGARPSPCLLHLVCSSHPTESITRQLSDRLAASWTDRYGRSGYRFRDLVADPVPHIGPGYVALGRRIEQHGSPPPAGVAELIEDPQEQREWDLTRPLIAELVAADTVLIGTPMYNFSIPATLKAWIDRITFPGAYADPVALQDTRVIVVSARGGAYGPGTPREGMDFQEPYLRAYFLNLGVAAVQFVHAELTLAHLMPAMAGLRPLAEQSMAAARQRVSELADQLQAG